MWLYKMRKREVARNVIERPTGCLGFNHFWERKEGALSLFVPPTTRAQYRRAPWVSWTRVVSTVEERGVLFTKGSREEGRMGWKRKAYCHTPEGCLPSLGGSPSERSFPTPRRGKKNDARDSFSLGGDSSLNEVQTGVKLAGGLERGQ